VRCRCRREGDRDQANSNRDLKVRLFWLPFKRDDDGIEVRIEAAHFQAARLKAGLAGQEGEFAEGIELDAKTASKVPTDCIGRALSAEHRSS
jgi:hypothetical protein